MSNKVIGIKQADGSFYPILQDGKPANKRLDLTTVRDNQTTVQIDLYKKTQDSLDEPEYVDSLLIENLIPHPKNEPTINLNLNLNEDNVLAAEVSDPETGKTSDIRVSMVTLPENRLSDTPDFSLTAPPSDAAPPFTDGLDDFSAAAQGADSAENADTVNTAEDTAAQDLSDFELPDFDLPPADSPQISEHPPFDMPDEITGDTAEDTQTAAPVSFDMPDFGEDDAFAHTAEEELSLHSETPLSFDTDGLDDFSAAAQSADSAEHADTVNNAEDTAAPDLSDFELPDFDLPPADSPQLSENPPFDMPDEITGDAAKDTQTAAPVSFDMPDFGENDAFAHTAEKELSLHSETPLSFDTDGLDDFSAAAQSAAPSFDMQDDTLDFESDPIGTKPKKPKFGHTKSFKETPPLYDPDLPDAIDEPCTKKRCRISVVICIICAVLCILAVIGIFLLFPWKKTEIELQNNIVAVEPPAQMQPPEVPAKPEENTITLVEKETVEQREVIPEKVEPAPETKMQAVHYRIKWGDTLWDLSDTYYRNPWLYTIIARENNIKNPDLIIAGTYITIPPR